MCASPTWTRSGTATTLRVLKLGRTSVTLGGTAFDGDQCAAMAEVVGVLIDLETRKAHRAASGLA
jgi:acyl-CoA thioesterase FadM